MPTEIDNEIVIPSPLIFCLRLSPVRKGSGEGAMI